LLAAGDGPIVKGRDGIRQLWTSMIKDMGLKSVKLESLELEVAGDSANEVGQATLGLAPPGGQSVSVVVKYVVVWKKSGGQWRIHRDIWNTKAA
jgi:ketosteroid isomerase-like protein